MPLALPRRRALPDATLKSNKAGAHSRFVKGKKNKKKRKKKKKKEREKGGQREQGAHQSSSAKRGARKEKKARERREEDEDQEEKEREDRAGKMGRGEGGKTRCRRDDSLKRRIRVGERRSEERKRARRVKGWERWQRGKG